MLFYKKLIHWKQNQIIEREVQQCPEARARLNSHLLRSTSLSYLKILSDVLELICGIFDIVKLHVVCRCNQF